MFYPLNYGDKGAAILPTRDRPSKREIAGGASGSLEPLVSPDPPPEPTGPGQEEGKENGGVGQDNRVSPRTPYEGIRGGLTEVRRVET